MGHEKTKDKHHENQRRKKHRQHQRQHSNDTHDVHKLQQETEPDQNLTQTIPKLTESSPNIQQTSPKQNQIETKKRRDENEEVESSSTSAKYETDNWDRNNLTDQKIPDLLDSIQNLKAEDEIENDLAISEILELN